MAQEIFGEDVWSDAQLPIVFYNIGIMLEEVGEQLRGIDSDLLLGRADLLLFSLLLWKLISLLVIRALGQTWESALEISIFEVEALVFILFMLAEYFIGESLVPQKT